MWQRPTGLSTVTKVEKGCSSVVPVKVIDGEGLYCTFVYFKLFSEDKLVASVDFLMRAFVSTNVRATIKSETSVITNFVF